MHIALVGNFNEGFRFVGPFISFEQADSWDLDRDQRERDYAPVAWFAELQPPEGYGFISFPISTERVMEVTELNREQATEILRRLPEAVENSTIPEALDELVWAIATDMED
jgi:hypothetical protein